MTEWMPLRAPEPGLERTPLPLIDVLVVGPTDACVEVPAVVDTGSSLSVFPTDLLKTIGVKFHNPQTVQAVVGDGAAMYKLGDPVIIECMFGRHAVPLTTYASDGADMVMLGVNDFLRHFDLIVNKSNNRFRLTPSEPGCCTPPDKG
jgi:hypothetical protein